MAPVLTGLVLGGGGARAAYQVGVLRAISRIQRECTGPAGGNPFDIICGTSAGAINAAALACHADDHESSVRSLCAVWENFEAGEVYRTDSLGLLGNGAKWLTMLSLGWMLARWRRARPRSLLDNDPLKDLLQRLVPTHRLASVLAEGHLRALAITASSYSTGEHVTFYQCAQAMQPWTRSQRRAEVSAISHEHLLASAAIPFVFPAREVPREGKREWFGDGSMRQTAPISPAIHLGAQRVLVIGAGRMLEPQVRAFSDSGYPTLAQVAGHAMSSIFLDALAVDVERLERINRTLALLPPVMRTQTLLRPIEALVIAPSQRIDDLAAEHQHHLPAAVRTLLRAVGGSTSGGQSQGAVLASYLLFEAPFTRALMALGESDALTRREEVLRFFSWSELRSESVAA